jgi:IclR family transcriptional regulator, KDG regulon repressor
VERTLDVLESILKQGDEVSLEEIAEMTGISVSATRRFASTLAKRGYLYQGHKGGKYSLGVKFLQFSDAINVTINVREKTYPFLQKLANETVETVHTAIISGLEAINIATIVPKQVLRISPDLGTINRYPLHCTTPGKIVIAYMDDKVIDGILDNMEFNVYTDNTITDKTKFKTEIEAIRRDSVAFDDEEYLKGVRSVASPIKDENGHVIATVCVVSPAVRVSRAKLKQLAPIVKKCALSMSQALGYKGE